jgi:hypothetical protein
MIGSILLIISIDSGKTHQSLLGAHVQTRLLDHERMHHMRKQAYAFLLYPNAWIYEEFVIVVSDSHRENSLASDKPISILRR